MKSIKLIFFLFVFFSITSVLRAEDSSSLLRDVSQKLSLLESKISRLNDTQAQMIQKHEAINQELDSLRIWIRRHRGG